MSCASISSMPQSWWNTFHLLSCHSFKYYIIFIRDICSSLIDYSQYDDPMQLHWKDYVPLFTSLVYNFQHMRETIKLWGLLKVMDILIWYILNIFLWCILNKDCHLLIIICINLWFFNNHKIFFKTMTQYSSIVLF